MIVGAGNDVIPTNPLDVIRMSAFEFHLTGSRFFGGYDKNSDWDFFAANSAELQSFLVKNGFRLMSRSYSNSVSIARVYRSNDNLVDVQLVDDIPLRLIIREIMIKPFIDLRRWCGLNKGQRKAVEKIMWNAAYAAATRR